MICDPCFWTIAASHFQFDDINLLHNSLSEFISFHTDLIFLFIFCKLLVFVWSILAIIIFHTFSMGHISTILLAWSAGFNAMLEGFMNTVHGDPCSVNCCYIILKYDLSIRVYLDNCKAHQFFDHIYILLWFYRLRLQIMLTAEFALL